MKKVLILIVVCLISACNKNSAQKEISLECPPVLEPVFELDEGYTIRSQNRIIRDLIHDGTSYFLKQEEFTPSQKAEEVKKLLNLAAQYCLLSEVEKLLKTGVDINEKEAEQILINLNKGCYFSEPEREEKIRELLLSIGANKNIINEERNNNYNKNSDTKDLEEIENFINEYSSQDKFDYRGRLHIISEIIEADTSKIEQFIDKAGAKSNIAVSLLNYMALDYYGNVDKIKLLLDKGVDVNAKDVNGNTVLHNVAADNDPKIDRIKFLLENGADINAKDKLGRTPLHNNVAGDPFNERIEVAKLFIEKGANVNAKDKLGNTPLHYIFGYSQGHSPAVYYKIDLVKVLLDKGADINAKNDYGITPIFYAARCSSKDLEVLEFLISKGADVNVKNKWGQTPIMWTKNSSDKKTAQTILIKNGAKKEDIKDENLNFLTKCKEEEIISLIKTGNKEKLEEYFKQGFLEYYPSSERLVNNIPNNTFSFKIKKVYSDNSAVSTSLLIIAATYNQVEIAKMLIDYGEDVNDGQECFYPGDGYSIADSTSYTSPLRIAVIKGHKEMVEFLISKGAKLNIEDSNGRTELEYVTNNEIKDILIKAGAKKGSGFVRRLM